MHLHEYQSKELLRAYGLPIGDFRVSTKALGIGKFAYELARARLCASAKCTPVLVVRPEASP